MSEDERKAIHRVQGDAGEDAHNAPTKVGPLADASVRELMRAAEQRAAELTAKNAERQAAARMMSSMPTPLSVKPSALEDPPRLYDDADENTDAATLLHTSARPGGPVLPSFAMLHASSPPPPTSHTSVPPRPRTARPRAWVVVLVGIVLVLAAATSLALAYYVLKY